MEFSSGPGLGWPESGIAGAAGHPAAARNSWVLAGRGISDRLPRQRGCGTHWRLFHVKPGPAAGPRMLSRRSEDQPGCGPSRPRIT